MPGAECVRHHLKALTSCLVDLVWCHIDRSEHDCDLQYELTDVSRIERSSKHVLSAAQNHESRAML